MNQQQAGQQQNLPSAPPQPPEPKYRFRWSIFLGVPLAALFFFWLLNGVEASFSFESIMERLHIIHEHK